MTRTTNEVLTVDDLAALLQVSRAQVVILLNKGELPEPQMIGKRRRWAGRVVRDWLETWHKNATEGVNHAENTSAG